MLQSTFKMIGIEGVSGAIWPEEKHFHVCSCNFEQFLPEKVRYKNHWVGVSCVKREGLKVWVDGELRTEQKALESPVVIQL